MKMTAFWDTTPCTIALMEAASTSETPVNFYEPTWRNIAEGCHLYN
jgi:hypothetical protein